MKHVFLCSQPRCGTYLFLQLLSTCQPAGQKIFNLGESLFTPSKLREEPIYSILGDERHAFCLSKRIYNPSGNERSQLVPNDKFDPEVFVRNIARLYDGLHDAPCMAIKWFPGPFQQMLHHLDITPGGDIAAQLQSVFGEVVFVRLIRQDIARQAISSYLRDYTDISHDREALLKVLPDVPYDFDALYAQYCSIREQNLQWDRLVAQYGISCLEVTYEGFSQDFGSIIDPLQDRLGIPLRIPKPEDVLTQPLTSPKHEEFLAQLTADLQARETIGEKARETPQTRSAIILNSANTAAPSRMKHLFLCSQPRSGTALFLALLKQYQPPGQKIHTLWEGVFQAGAVETRPVFREVLGDTDMASFCLNKITYNDGRHIGQAENERFDPVVFSRSIAKLYAHQHDSPYISIKWFAPEFQLFLQKMGIGFYGDLNAWLEPIFGQVAFVRLIRENRASQAVSHYLAEKTGVAHNRNLMLQRLPEVGYQFEAIYSKYQSIEANNRLWDTMFAQYGIQPLTFTYETFIADYSSVIDPLRAYLGVNLVVPEPEEIISQSMSTEVNSQFRERFLADLQAMKTKNREAAEPVKADTPIMLPSTPPMKHLFLCTVPQSGAAKLLDILHQGQPEAQQIPSLGRGLFDAYYFNLHPTFRLALGEDFPYCCLFKQASDPGEPFRQVENDQFDPERLGQGLRKLHAFLGNRAIVSILWHPREFQVLLDRLAPHGSVMAQLEAVFGEVHFVHLGQTDLIRQAVCQFRVNPMGLGQVHQVSVLTTAPEASYDFDAIYRIYRELQQLQPLWAGIFEQYCIEPLMLSDKAMAGDYDNVIGPLRDYLTFPLLTPKPDPPSNQGTSATIDTLCEQFRADLQRSEGLQPIETPGLIHTASHARSGMKHLFLCSLPRSGTNLFQNIIDIYNKPGEHIPTFGKMLFAPRTFRDYPNILAELGMERMQAACAFKPGGKDGNEEIDNEHFDPEAVQAAIPVIYRIRCSDHYLCLRCFVPQFGPFWFKMFGTPDFYDAPSLLEPLFGEVKFVRLQRDDLIGQAISRFIAGETGKFTILKEDPLTVPNVTYDFDGLYLDYQNCVNETAFWDRFFEQSGIEPLVLTYETMVHDFSYVIEPLNKLLGTGLRVPTPDVIHTQPTHTELNDRFRERFMADLKAKGLLPHSGQLTETPSG